MFSTSRRTTPFFRRLSTIAGFLCVGWLLGTQVVPQLQRLRYVRNALLSRSSAVKRAANSETSFAVLTQIKNEAMGLREWLAHYTWQGADIILLLDNGSTDIFRNIVADFPNTVVLPAPELYAQTFNFGEIGRPWLEEHGVEYVLVTDADNFFWSERSGKTLKDLVIEGFGIREDASQFTCPFHHFGSNGYEKQPKSVRECLTKRSAVTSAVQFGSSVVRLRNLVRFNIEAHTVRGKTVPCPEGLLNFHYKAQSREYWAKIKLPRGDAVNKNDDGYRSWAQFELEDKIGNATSDFRLRDALRNARIASGLC